MTVAVRTRRKRAIGTAISVIVVVAIFSFVLPRIADLSAVWRHIRDMTGLEVIGLALVGAANLVTSWLVIRAATPGLTIPQAAVVSQSSTAVSNAVPGGAAVAVGVTYAMLGSWGFSASRSTLSVLVSGLWDTFVKLGLPVLAITLLALQGEKAGPLGVVGVLGLAVLVGAVGLFALALRREDVAVKAGEVAARALRGPRRLLRKDPAEGWGAATAKFRGRAIGLVRRSWLQLTVASLLNHLTLYLVLLVSLRDVGVSNDEVGWAEVLAAFAFVRLLTAIPITPGGLGIVEVALIGACSAAGGDHAQVVAAVLVFRLLTYVVPIALGVLTYLYWRTNTTWLDSAPPLAGTEPAQAV